MLRFKETAKDYKDLTNQAIMRTLAGNLVDLTETLKARVPSGKISRAKMIKASYTINNLLKELEK